MPKTTQTTDLENAIARLELARQALYQATTRNRPRNPDLLARLGVEIAAATEAVALLRLPGVEADVARLGEPLDELARAAADAEAAAREARQTAEASRGAYLDARAAHDNRKRDLGALRRELAEARQTLGRDLIDDGPRAA
jgi:hypothetical protein